MFRGRAAMPPTKTKQKTKKEDMYTEYDLLYAFIPHFGPQNLKILAVPLFMLQWLYIPCPFF